MVKHGPLVASWILLIALHGCSGDLSDTQVVFGPTSFTFADLQSHDVRIEAAPETAVLIAVSGRDIDVRAALVHAGVAPVAFADAPNRRMGVETLLVEAPHEPVLTVRIARNDHREARGTAELRAVVLPLATDGDRRRLEATRLEAAACLTYPDLKEGTESATAFESAAALHEENGDRRNAGMALLHAAGARYARLSDWPGAAQQAARAVRELDRSDAEAYAAYALRVEGAALDQRANAADFNRESRDRTIELARERLTEAAERFNSLGNNYEAGYALNYRGVSRQEAGDRELARADFHEAFQQFRAAGDRPAQAMSLQSLAVLSHEAGHMANAMREFDQALALIPRDTDAENYAHTLHNSALPLRVLGRFDEAIARYYEAGRILRERGDRDGEARALHGLGTAMLYAGEPERAAELLRSAVRLRGQTGAGREQATSLSLLGQIEREAGRLDTAIALHRRASGLVSAPHDRALAHLALARDFLAAGKPALARRELDQVLRLDLPETHRNLGLALAELGDLESLADHPEDARDHFARAIRIHEANGSDVDHARTLYRRAEAMARSGDTQTALNDTAAAIRLFDAIGQQGLQAESRAAFRASYRDAVELRIATLLVEAQSATRNGNVPQAQRLLRSALAASDRARA